VHLCVQPPVALLAVAQPLLQCRRLLLRHLAPRVGRRGLVRRVCLHALFRLLQLCALLLQRGLLAAPPRVCLLLGDDQSPLAPLYLEERGLERLLEPGQLGQPLRHRVLPRVLLPPELLLQRREPRLLPRTHPRLPRLAARHAAARRARLRLGGVRLLMRARLYQQ
jgi:hypothetical protein